MDKICLMCPRACKLDRPSCEKGTKEAKKASRDLRIFTASIAINSEEVGRLPVKTRSYIKKQDQVRLSLYLETIRLKSPIEIGQVVVENPLGLGVDLVATRTIKK